jgi:hypothetical protein
VKTKRERGGGLEHGERKMMNEECKMKNLRRGDSHGGAEGAEVKWSCKRIGADATIVSTQDLSVKSVLSVVKGLEIR